MSERNIRKIALFAGIAILFACAPLAAPTVPPTLDPFALDTAIAQTAGAAATQTAIFAPATFTPSPTLFASNTPTEIPSATPTFIFILASLTPTARPTNSPAPSSGGTDYACAVQSQEPADNSEFLPNATFTTRWHVKNTGARAWNSNSTDYRYVSGDKLHVNSIYDLSNSVSPGGTADITVSMIAPPNSGSYSTTWRLQVGKTEFCTMRLTIIVK